MEQPDAEGSRGYGAGLLSIAGSRRLLSVVLMSFASGVPLGIVWFAIPAWMARVGVDIKVIGLFTLAQAPWSFKLLWSPWMDRYPPPFLGRKRGWILLGQIALFVVILALAGVSSRPEAVGVIGALAFAIALASATQDIAIDAYAVEVLHRDELGFASGARTAFYRAAMLVSGGASITLAAETSWTLVNLLLALLYLPFMAIAFFAPEPASLPPPPRTLREAVWGPFVGFLAQHRSIEILAFVVLYKLGDNLTQSLTGPFLVQTGFDDFDVGIARTTIGQAAMIGGTLLGGILTDRMGLGRALWVFGFLQLVSNLGYAAVAHVGPSRVLMYGAQAFELGSSGLGQGAFGVLLMRLTQKRFSATQYALLSSLFTLPRILAGPITGVLAAAMGWRDFFVLTVVFGVPGMAMLARFVPWGVRDVEFEVQAPARGEPLARRGLAARAALGAAVTLLAGVGALALAGGLSSVRNGGGFQVLPTLAALVRPHGAGEWTTSVGLLVLAGLGGLATAATLAARRGVRSPPRSGQSPRAGRRSGVPWRQEGTPGAGPVSKRMERTRGGTMGVGEMPLEAQAPTAVSHDRELVASCRNGDPAAFARLVGLHEGMVFNLAARLLGDPEEARDVAQEVFLQVYRMLGRFEARSTLKTWIYRIAVNQCHNRRRFWHRRRRDRELALDEGLLGDDALGAREGAGTSPFEEARRSERAGRVQAALLELSFEHRSVLVLREVEGLTCGEVAHALGVPEGTVKSRLSRAREAMRLLLQGRVEEGRAS